MENEVTYETKQMEFEKSQQLYLVDVWVSPNLGTGLHLNPDPRLGLPRIPDPDISHHHGIWLVVEF